MGPSKDNIEDQKAPVTLTLDVDYYQAMLDDTAIPDDQKQELIETLWWIVVSFVDLGFGIHPLQQDETGLSEDGLAILQKLITEATNQDHEDEQTQKENQFNKETS